MLTEFAFTPAVFDQDAHADKADWRIQLKEILQALRPSTGVSPVVVSDLISGSWWSEVHALLNSVDDHKLKQVCQDLITVLPGRLVHRAMASAYPFDDPGWCKEALASHLNEKIDRIVSTEETKTTVGDPSVRTIDELETTSFWNGVDSVTSLESVISKQIPKLRTLCLHSEWIGFCNPWGATTESDFTVEFIKSLLSLPAEFCGLDIEVHFAKNDGDDAGRKVVQSRQANYIRSKVGAPATTKLSCNVFVWKKLLERTLIGGLYTTDGAGNKRKKAKWGISMTHVARSETPDTEDHRWRLMERTELSKPFGDFLDDNSGQRPNPDKAI